MKFEVVHSHVKDVPYMGLQKGKVMYDFILREQPTNVLELGFAHGTGSCYIAAALGEIGRGRLTSVDLLSSTEREPNLEALLARTGLEPYVEIVREHDSYTWFLKKKIEERTESGICQPLYDFCFIDGSKNWTVDGAAFFMVDKLLRHNGWVLFDDYSWTYEEYERNTGRSATDGISHRGMAIDEKTSPHIEAIFRLLVMQHPDYGRFKIQDDYWAWAQKTGLPIKRLDIETNIDMKARAVRLMRRLLRRDMDRQGPFSHGVSCGDRR